eukprot:Hpha_TRINITY_DN14261_c0_g1::TRINITY_DN14261_c0_g1_i2::g.22543::m.22543
MECEYVSVSGFTVSQFFTTHSWAKARLGHISAPILLFRKEKSQLTGSVLLTSDDWGGQLEPETTSQSLCPMEETEEEGVNGRIQKRTGARIGWMVDWALASSPHAISHGRPEEEFNGFTTNLASPEGEDEEQKLYWRSPPKGTPFVHHHKCSSAHGGGEAACGEAGCVEAGAGEAGVGEAG